MEQSVCEDFPLEEPVWFAAQELLQTMKSPQAEDVGLNSCRYSSLKTQNCPQGYLTKIPF